MDRSRKIGKILKNQVMPRPLWLLHFIFPGAAAFYFPGGYSWEFSKSWPYLCPKNVIFYTSLRKQPTFHDATTGFPAKWRLKKERRNSILMTRHYPDRGSDSDRRYRVGNLIQPIRRSTQVLNIAGNFPYVECALLLVNSRLHDYCIFTWLSFVHNARCTAT